MQWHAVGTALGTVGEFLYRVFARIPPLVGLSAPFAVYVALLAAGYAIFGWQRSWAPWLIPVIAFAVSTLIFEMAVLTYLVRTGRYTLMRLQGSLRDIRSQSPRDFERLVGAMYEQQGYAVDYPEEGP